MYKEALNKNCFLNIFCLFEGEDSNWDCSAQFCNFAIYFIKSQKSLPWVCLSVRLPVVELHDGLLLDLLYLVVRHLEDKDYRCLHQDALIREWRKSPEPLNNARD